jgi:O-antigen ligase
MSNRTARRTAESAVPPRTIPELFASAWIYPFIAIAAGIVVTQLVTGHLAPRWVKAMIGFFFLFALFRLPFRAVVILYLVAFPFPTYIYLGTTNMIFVFLMLVVWGIKISMGKEPIPPKTFLDWAGGAYILVHLLSLLNVPTGFALNHGIYQIAFLGFALGYYYILSKMIRTEDHLKSALKALVVTSLIVSCFGMAEWAFPKTDIIPRWFIAAGSAPKRLGAGAFRLAGIFGSQVLTADFNAILFILLLFMFIRTKSMLAKAGFASMMAASILQIILSANRGGFLIWTVGLIYFTWLARGRGADFARRLIILSPVLMAVGLAVEKTNSRYLKALLLISRLEGTQFEGALPDTRVMVWRSVMKEIPEHPWIGHGPYYDLLGPGGAIVRFWPHSGYLWYWYTTGIIGLLVFLYILLKALYKSFPGGNMDIKKASFAHGAMLVAHVQILQFLIAQIRDEHQRGDIYPYFMWTLIGLAAAAVRIRSQQIAASRAGDRTAERLSAAAGGAGPYRVAGPAP